MLQIRIRASDESTSRYGFFSLQDKFRTPCLSPTKKAAAVVTRGPEGFSASRNANNASALVHNQTEQSTPQQDRSVVGKLISGKRNPAFENVESYLDPPALHPG